MKNKNLVIIWIVFSLSFSGLCLAIENPPLGSGRMPASNGESGLVRSPNPIDTSGNLIVTGNVGGGKHFRGVVPYRAATDFSVPLSSSAIIDPFLRRSVSVGDYLRITGRPETYYSPSQTVTSTIPGSGSVIRQPIININTGGFALPALPQRKVLFTKPDDILDIGLRPMSRTGQQLENVILGDIETYLREKRLKATQLEEEEKKFQSDLEDLREKTSKLKKGFVDEDELLQETDKPKDEPETDSKEVQMLLDPLKQSGLDRQTDVYDLMQRQLIDLQKELKKLKQEEGRSKTEEDGRKEKTSVLGELSEKEISAEARRLLGEHKTFASYSTSKFNQYMMAGEEYLKQGKYYWAADAYTMASIYKSSDPLAYAGKSHALFVAGEYMSSALFLSRTLEMFPEYAYFEVDLAGMINNQDVLEKRIADIRHLVFRNQSPELEFLLAYVFHRMHQKTWSRELIDLVCEKMPESTAAAALKKAIDAAAKK